MTDPMQTTPTGAPDATPTGTPNERQAALGARVGYDPVNGRVIDRVRFTAATEASRIRGMLASGRDLDAREELEEIEARLQSAVDAAPLAAVSAAAPDERALIQDREALNAFARTLPPGGWALLILGCECPAIVARVEDGGRAYAEIRPVDLSPEGDDAHEHDAHGWLSTRALDYPVLVQHNPAALAARPAPVVSGADVEAAVRNWRFEHYDGPDGDEVHMGSCVLVEDLWHILAALGITVADAPAAEPEPWECHHQPRCADAACSHNPAMQRWASGTAADDEGGQER